MTHYTRNQFNAVMEAILGERLPGRPDQDITEVTTVQNFVLAARRQIRQSVYRYGQVGAVNLALGVLCQSPVPPANHHGLVPAASYPVGTRIVTLTLGATPLAADEMAGGWLHVNDGTGQGQAFRILSHPAALAAATCQFTLIDPITTAFNVADTLCALTANPYAAVIIHPSPPTARLVGVPVAAMAAGSFGWFKTRGPAAVLTAGVLYIHRGVRASPTVDGAVSHASLEVTMSATAPAAEDANGRLVTTSAGADDTIAFSGMAAAVPAAGAHDIGHTQLVVGKVMRVEVDTDYSLIDLCLE